MNAIDVKFGLRSPKSHSIVHNPLLAGITLQLQDVAQHAPPSIDYHAALRLEDAPPDPLGNDRSPNCVEAGYLRQAQLREANAMGSVWKPSAAEALALLPQWGNPTLGTNVADAQRLAAVQGIDIGGLDLDVPLPVDVPLDSRMLNAATWAFGSVGLCWALPAYLFSGATLPTIWDVASAGTPATQQMPGDGHYTPSGAYSVKGRRIITWGLDVVVTDAFASRYLVAASAQLSRRWYDARGLSLAGFDWDQTETLRNALAA